MPVHQHYHQHYHYGRRRRTSGLAVLFCFLFLVAAVITYPYVGVPVVIAWIGFRALSRRRTTKAPATYGSPAPVKDGSRLRAQAEEAAEADLDDVEREAGLWD